MRLGLLVGGALNQFYVMLCYVKESVEDASYVTDQVIRKFAIHAINVTVLYALTTAKCCARSVTDNINIEQ